MRKCGTSAKTYTLNIFRGFRFHLKISSLTDREKRERVAFCAAEDDDRATTVSSRGVCSALNEEAYLFPEQSQRKKRHGSAAFFAKGVSQIDS